MTRILTLLTVALALTLAGTGSTSPPLVFFLGSEEGVAAKIHSQEIAKDTTQKGDWIKSLHHKNMWLPLVAARSLSRMGITEALPDFDWLKNHVYYPENIAVWKARLIAEAEMASVKKTTASEAEQKLARFFEELNVTPQWVNDEINKYQEARKEWIVQKTQFPKDPPSHPLAELTMYEVADMIYRSDNPEAWVKLPQVKALDFKLSPRSALKVRYATVPLSRRPALMAEELSKSVKGRESDTLMQMMWDLGKPAREAVATKIEEIASNEKPYLQQKVTYEGKKYETVPAYRLLFGFLADSGDKSYEPLMNRMRTNKTVYAQAYDCLNVRGPVIYDPGL